MGLANQFQKKRRKGEETKNKKGNTKNGCEVYKNDRTL